MDDIFKHYSEYQGPWPWPDFTPAEVACKHCGELYLDRQAMSAIQKLRELLGRPVFISSGHRCAEHNRNVGGASESMHLKIAFDCRCPGGGQPAFCAKAREAGFTGFGRYPARGFVHLDLGKERIWWG